MKWDIAAALVGIGLAVTCFVVGAPILYFPAMIAVSMATENARVGVIEWEMKRKCKDEK